MRKLLAILILAASCVASTSDPPQGGAGSGSGSGSGDNPGECPADETCSPRTPNGLVFTGAVPANMAFPNGLFSDVHNHIATGATDDIRLQLRRSDGSLGDIDVPFAAVSSTPGVITVEQTQGATVTLRAHGGTALLRIVDPGNQDLYDRYAYASSPRTALRPIPTREQVTATDFFQGAAQSYVFARGDVSIAIALLNDATPANRLVDSALTLTLAGATQTAWDTLHIPAATTGHKTIAVTTGDGATTDLDVEIVAGADSIVPIVSEDWVACFAALAHGTFIAGLTWTFTVDGSPVAGEDAISPNCVFNPNGGGTFTVTATAGGRSTTITTTPGAAHLRAGLRAPARDAPPASPDRMP